MCLGVPLSLVSVKDTTTVSMPNAGPTGGSFTNGFNSGMNYCIHSTCTRKCTHAKAHTHVRVQATSTLSQQNNGPTRGYSLSDLILVFIKHKQGRLHTHTWHDALMHTRAQLKHNHNTLAYARKSDKMLIFTNLNCSGCVVCMHCAERTHCLHQEEAWPDCHVASNHWRMLNWLLSQLFMQPFTPLTKHKHTCIRIRNLASFVSLSHEKLTYPPLPI